MTPLRLVFMGTPELARTVLVMLADAPGVHLEAVVAQPDRPAGRQLQLTPPPVKVEALSRGLPVLQPLKARDPEFVEKIRQLAPDLIVVAAFGQILPPALLDLPKLGCLNVHTSLLPRWRGAAPIQWALAAGDSETGATIIKMDAGLDTGPILRAIRTPIADTDDSRTLHHRLAHLGAQLLIETIPEYAAGRCPPIAQPTAGVTHARKITREDGRLDWSQSAVTLANRIRAFTPWPGAYCFLPGLPKPKLLKVHAARPVVRTEPTAPGGVVRTGSSGIEVACAEGALCLTELQLEGGRRLAAATFLAGHPLIRLE